MKLHEYTISFTFMKEGHIYHNRYLYKQNELNDCIYLLNKKYDNYRIDYIMKDGEML